MDENSDLFVVATAASEVSSYKVRVTFPGETSASSKRFQVINTAGISSGVRVLCARVSGTWVVLGPLLG